MGLHKGTVVHPVDGFVPPLQAHKPQLGRRELVLALLMWSAWMKVMS